MMVNEHNFKPTSRVSMNNSVVVKPHDAQRTSTGKHFSMLKISHLYRFLHSL